MSPDKDAALCRDFPHLFRDRNAPMNQTSMCWGFQFSDGWYKIIYDAASKIEPILVKMIDEAVKNKNYEALDFVPAASCLKEKFGTLSWYMTESTEEIDQIINEAEDKSATTCELCGDGGNLRGAAWVSTYCDSCWKKEWEDKHIEE